MTINITNKNNTQYQKKQSTTEKLWLIYFNETLFNKGIISEDTKNKMTIKINNRSA